MFAPQRPREAAELVAPQTLASLETLSAHAVALTRRMRTLIDAAEQRLDRDALRLARPGELVRRRSHALDLLSQRIASAATRAIAAGLARVDTVGARQGSALTIAFAMASHRLEAASTRLAAVDPRRVLSRGYVLLSDPGGRPVTTIGRISERQMLRATLADGQADVVVTAVRSADAAP